MADVNGVVIDTQAIAAAGFLTVQPSTGQEWLIKNIFHADAVEYGTYDGSLAVAVDSDAGAGAWLSLSLFVTNADYIRVKNTTTSTQNIGYSGVRIV